MKIYIVGPTCVGKTTLAKRLSNNYGVVHVDLDLVFIDYKKLKKSKKFGYVDEKEYEKRIQSILDMKDGWVAEGVYPVTELFEKADVIMLIKREFYVPLVWQWRRFFSDKRQRQIFGFWNNVCLSKDIIRQYFGSFNLKYKGNPKIFTLKKYEYILKEYSDKMIVISDNHQIDNILVILNNINKL